VLAGEASGGDGEQLHLRGRAATPVLLLLRVCAPNTGKRRRVSAGVMVRLGWAREGRGEASNDLSVLDLFLASGEKSRTLEAAWACGAVSPLS
jgi:hypothetical protein